MSEALKPSLTLPVQTTKGELVVIPSPTLEERAVKIRNAMLP